MLATRRRLIRPLSMLSIDAYYHLHHGGALGPHLEGLMDIPGVRPVQGSPTVLLVPWNAGPAVQRVIREDFGWGTKKRKKLRWDKPEVSRPSPKALHRRLRKQGELDPDVLRQAYDFQVVDARRCLYNGGGHVWASPGAGKTWIALMWVLAVTKGPVLVVAPAGIRRQWARVVQNLTNLEPLALRPPSSHRQSMRCLGKKSGGASCGSRAPLNVGYCHRHRDQWDGVERAEGLSPDSVAAYLRTVDARGKRPFVIMGFDQARDLGHGVVKDLRSRAIIIDESHEAKSHKQEDWEVEDDNWVAQPLHNVARRTWEIAKRHRYRLAMTASPAANTLLDLWAQARLIEPYAWGRTGKRFAYRYVDAQDTQYGWSILHSDGSDGESNSDELTSRLAFTCPTYRTEDGRLVRRIPYEVTHGHLPPLVRRVAYLDREALGAPLPGLQTEMNRLRKLAERGDLSARGMLIELQFMAAAERKLPATIERVKDWMLLGDGMVVVFTSRKRAVDWLAKKLEPTVQRAGGQILTISGDTPAAVADAYIQTFRNNVGKRPTVLIGTHQKIGQGVDGMQVADVLHYNAMMTTPKEWEQTPGRGDRVDRVKTQLHDILIAEGTIEERRISSAIRKIRTTNAVHAGSRLDDTPDVLEALDGEMGEDLMDDLWAGIFAGEIG